jgi:GntR family transcriptional repressor for pyruvate dehydrogenase complex
VDAIKKQFSPIEKRPRAFEEVVASIKEAIFRGDWKPGDRLPSENHLAGQFGVSRHTVREALRTLELSGLLTIRTGVSGGPVVRDRIANTIGKLYIDALQMEKITAEELTAARLVIEKAIMDEAIDNRDEEDIERLQRSIEKSKGFIDQGELARALNFDFHTLLAQASKNRVYAILSSGINAILHDLSRRSPVDLKTTQKAVESHEKILDALKSRNRKKAIQLIEGHISQVGKAFDDH